MLVAADREDIAAELGPAQHEAGEQRQHDHVEHRVGDAEQPGAAAERQQLVVIGPELEHHRVVRGDHRQAARDRQHAERHHERREAEIGDQHAVEGADDERGGDRRGDADLDAVAGVHDDRQHHAAQAQHRADREVDAAGDDHHRHAERDDRDEGDVAGDVVEVLRGGEGIGGERQEDAGDDDRDEHPEGLAGQHRRRSSSAASGRSSCRA